MLDEEKKAINQLKADTNFYDYELKNGKYIYELFKIEVYKKDVDVILNLIEKQSKQIEKLQVINQMQKYRIEVMDERELISRDEVEEIIKIKIEENKWAIEHYDCDEADYKQSQAIGAWNVLQSILDKIKGDDK